MCVMSTPEHLFIVRLRIFSQLKTELMLLFPTEKYANVYYA